MDTVVEFLSVSSVGSEAMQLELDGVEATAVYPFQYPRSDRRRCNDRVAELERRLRESFSILGRIGGDATQTIHEFKRCEPRPFSILGRIGGDATIRRAYASILEKCFQYPRSDRRRCNGRVSGTEAPTLEAFSILGRIGGDATPPTELVGATEVVFQYPRSDRRRCNLLFSLAAAI